MASQAWAPCGAPSLVRATPKRSSSCQRHTLAGGVGSYNHRDSGEEGEWRRPLLCANPSGHHVPATYSEPLGLEVMLLLLLLLLLLLPLLLHLLLLLLLLLPLLPLRDALP